MARPAPDLIGEGAILSHSRAAQRFRRRRRRHASFAAPAATSSPAPPASTSADIGGEREQVAPGRAPCERQREDAVGQRRCGARVPPQARGGGGRRAAAASDGSSAPTSSRGAARSERRRTARRSAGATAPSTASTGAGAPPTAAVTTPLTRSKNRSLPPALSLASPAPPRRCRARAAGTCWPRSSPPGRRATARARRRPSKTTSIPCRSTCPPQDRARGREHASHAVGRQHARTAVGRAVVQVHPQVGSHVLHAGRHVARRGTAPHASSPCACRNPSARCRPNQSRCPGAMPSAAARTHPPSKRLCRAGPARARRGTLRTSRPSRPRRRARAGRSSRSRTRTVPNVSPTSAASGERIAEPNPLVWLSRLRTVTSSGTS